MALRRLTVRKAGMRPALFLGGDRELVMVTGLMSTVMILIAQDIIAALLGIALWFCAVFVFRKMAVHDPLLRKKYIRHLRYRKYYPARSTPFRVNRTVPGGQG